MAASLLDSLTGLITPDVATKAASMLGESDTSIRKGMGAALPVVLSGLANRAGDTGFSSSLFDLVRSPANDGAVLNDVGSLLGSGASSPMTGLGSKLLGLLFGGNTGSLGNTLAGYAGVKNTTGSTLINLAAPLVLAMLGKRTRSEGLNASSLASLLLGQKDSYAAALPGPLGNLSSYLATPTREREVREAYAAPPVPEQRSSIWRWLIPLLIALGVLWLLSSLFGRKERPAEVTTPPAAIEPAPAPTPEVVAPATAPQATVYFDVDQSALPAGSDTALSAVIDHLKANPGSTAVISGYHDATGDQAANEELAKNRAGSVRDTLMAAGIEETRITMDKPVVTTGGGTLEDARRVEVTVR